MSYKDVKNCSTIFLLPGVGHLRQDLLKYGFIGAYLDDAHHNIHYDKALYLMFKPENIKEFQDFLQKEYEEKPFVLEDYDYRGGFVVVVYKFNEKYSHEYELLKQGKYSKFSQEYISLFPMSTRVKNEFGIEEVKYSLHYHIFNRTLEIREYWERKTGEKIPTDMELWSTPDMEKEVLNITQFQT